jgi:lysophospholipase L1-like esterase
MGDSVAFGAAAAWPELLAERLRSRRHGRQVEVLNFGVPGYSVVQGLRQLPEVTRLSPDVVVVSYGWNDHWLARGGLPDSARKLPSPLLVRAASLASRLRFVQLLSAPLNRRAANTGAPSGTGAGGDRRVPPEEYEKLLGALVREIRSAGAAPLVVSLPSGLVERGFPPYLVDMGFTRSPSEAITDHRLYGELARRAAVLENVPFVALQPLFDDPEGRPVAGLFSPDGIHPTPEGHERIADALAEPVLGAARAR